MTRDALRNLLEQRVWDHVEAAGRAEFLQRVAHHLVAHHLARGRRCLLHRVSKPVDDLICV